MIRYICIKKSRTRKIYTFIRNIRKIAEVNKIPIDEILHCSNKEIKPISEMEDRNQKVVIFDDYVWEKNQGDIINYLMQGKYKNCCVIYLSQSYYKTPKNIRINWLHFKQFLKVLLNGRMNQYVMSMG